MKRKWILALVLVVICMLFSYTAAGDEKELTLMIYMTGSNLESEYFAASLDIQEMIQSRYQQDRVNVVIMTGGAEKWHSHGISAAALTIHHLERVNLIQDCILPLESMGSADVLSAFLQYGYDHFPARKYALIFWDHGSGPVNGVCMDEIFHGDMLLPMELAKGFENSPFHPENKLEWIGFDACLMANIETAHLLSPYARYMIASQETEPGCGWDYSFLSQIHLDETGADTGKRIIDLYYENALAQNPGNPITLSLIDLEKIQAVQAGMDGLFAALGSRISSYNFSEFAIQRRDAAGVGRSITNDSDYDLVDLMGLVQNYQGQAGETSAALSATIRQAVLYQKSNQENLSGLSIYHPYNNKTAYLNQWKKEYDKIAVSSAYLNYLDHYARIWMGEELTNWQGLQPQLQVAADQSKQTISLQLTPDQMKNFGSAELLVFSASESWGYSMIYREETNLPNEDGLLQINYTGKELVYCDKNGKILESDFSYFTRDGKIAMIGFLSNSDGLFDDEYKVVILYFELSDDGKHIEFLYAEESLDATTTSRHQIDFKEWKYFYAYKIMGDPYYDQNGNLYPYESWKNNSGLKATCIELKNGLNFQYTDKQVTSNPTAALLYVYDTQGNLHITSLLPLKHLAGKKVNIDKSTMINNDDFSMTLNDLEFIDSIYDPHIKINVQIENKSAYPLQISVDYASINDTIVIKNLSIDVRYSGIPVNEIIDTTIIMPIDYSVREGIDKIEKLILYGYINCDYEDDILFSTAPIYSDIEIYSDASITPFAVISSCESGGLLMEITNLSVNYDQGLHNQALVVDFRLINNTENDLLLHSYNSKINQYQINNFSDSLFIPAGHYAINQIKFYNFVRPHIDESSYNEYFINDLMGALQITDVNSIMLEWEYQPDNDWRNESVVLSFTHHLKETFPYVQYRTIPMGEPIHKKQIFENEAISINLLGITIQENRIHCILECFNKTNHKMAIEVSLKSINDKQIASEYDMAYIPENTVILNDFWLYLEDDLTPLYLNKELDTLSISYLVFNILGGEYYRSNAAWNTGNLKIHIEQLEKQNKSFYAEHLLISE